MTMRDTHRSHQPGSRRVALGLISALLACALLAGSAGQAGARARVPKKGAWFGAYVQATGGHDQYHSILSFEREIGRRLRVVNKYHGFSDHNYGVESQLVHTGRIPMISWRATDSGTDGSRASKIAGGQYDSLIRTTALAMKALKGRVLLRFNWEMDQDPGQRQYIGSPSEFIRAWRHVHHIFRSVGAHNVQFVWAPRAGSFKSGDGQSFWPGARYVDWIGGSAVPTGNWASFHDIFSDYYAWASGKHKPLLVWAGIMEHPGQSAWKANWISGASKVIRSAMPRVKAFVYYHALSPLGHRYYVDTSPQALRAYKAMAHQNWFQPKRLKH